MKPAFTLFAFLIFLNHPKKVEINDLHFLIGTWKVENKENYETWVLKDKNVLEGNSYKIRNGNKQIDEYLSIKISGDKIIYVAKVMNQNNAQPIAFVLNKTVKDKFSFENLTHDFPKKNTIYQT